MKGILASAVLAFLTVMGSAQAATQPTAGTQVLHVLNWNDYIDPSLVSDFEKRHGVKVEYSTYSSSEEAEMILRSQADIDVMVSAFERIPNYLEDKLLHPLNIRTEKNFDDFDLKVLSRLSSKDPHLEHTIPYLWGNMGIAINRQKAQAALGGEAPDSWALLFEEEYAKKLKSCGISALDSKDDVLSLYMNYRGYSLDMLNRRATQRYLGDFSKARQHYTYIDSERYVDDLSAGKLCVAMAWVGDAIAAREAGQPVDFIIPKEGTITFMDVMTIPARSKQKALATEFIKFMMTHESMDRNARYTYYLSPSNRVRTAMEADEKFAQMKIANEVNLFIYAPPTDFIAPLLDNGWGALMLDNGMVAGSN